MCSKRPAQAPVLTDPWIVVYFWLAASVQQLSSVAFVGHAPLSYDDRNSLSVQVVYTAVAKGGMLSSSYYLDRSACLVQRGGAASQAVATASARALSEGGEPALAIAHAYAYAIAVFSCPGVKPVIYSA